MVRRPIGAVRHILGQRRVDVAGAGQLVRAIRSIMRGRIRRASEADERNLLTGLPGRAEDRASGRFAAAAKSSRWFPGLSRTFVNRGCSTLDLGQDFDGTKVRLAPRRRRRTERRILPRRNRVHMLDLLAEQQHWAIVHGDAERMRGAAGPCDLGEQHDAVAVADLAGARHQVDRNDLVAGRQHGHRRPRMDADSGVAGHREEADLFGPQARTGRDDDVAAPHLDGRRLDVPGLFFPAPIWTRSATTSVRSTMTTASAPSGTPAPVATHIASPKPTAFVGTWPAKTSPTMRSVAPAAATSTARTAKPSIIACSNGGYVEVADGRLRHASGRPEGRGRAAAGTGLQEDDVVEHDAAKVVGDFRACGSSSKIDRDR